jgi:prepilin-type N-terminal cleavage/methylation domain-containing protein
MSKKFTLIELLVVVSIIGILASILLPSLGKAREKAKIAICIANHKQMAVSYIIYADENNQYAIQHAWYNDIIGYKGAHGWGYYDVDERPLNKYADPAIGECPSDKGDPYYSWNNNEFKTFGSSYLVTYATSTNIGKSTNIISSNGKVWSSGISIVGFDRPAKKIMAYNVNLTFARDWTTSAKGRWHDLGNPKYPVSFIDGHAKNFNFSWKKTSGNNPKGSDEWKIENLGYY